MYDVNSRVLVEQRPIRNGNTHDEEEFRKMFKYYDSEISINI
jgi:hypothetical protein